MKKICFGRLKIIALCGLKFFASLRAQRQRGMMPDFEISCFSSLRVFHYKIIGNCCDNSNGIKYSEKIPTITIIPGKLSYFPPFKLIVDKIRLKGGIKQLTITV